MSSFKSFVFLTIECTCDTWSDDNLMKTICLISASSSTIEGKPSKASYIDKLLLHVDDFEEGKNDTSTLDVLPKHSQTPNSKKSGFDRNVGQQIALFLERQEPPICLISHGGSECDFYLLSRNLASVGVILPINISIRCGDSLVAFRDLQPGLHNKDAYSIPHLYRDAFGAAPDDDKLGVEGDTIALMDIVIKGGAEIRKWFERNAVDELSKLVDTFATQSSRNPTSKIDKLYEGYTDCH